MLGFLEWLESYSATMVNGPINIPDSPDTRDKGFNWGKLTDKCTCSDEEREPSIIDDRKICLTCGKPILGE